MGVIAQDRVAGSRFGTRHRPVVAAQERRRGGQDRLFPNLPDHAGGSCCGIALRLERLEGPLHIGGDDGRLLGVDLREEERKQVFADQRFRIGSLHVEVSGCQRLRHAFDHQGGAQGAPPLWGGVEQFVLQGVFLGRQRLDIGVDPVGVGFQHGDLFRVLLRGFHEVLGGEDHPFAPL